MSEVGVAFVSIVPSARNFGRNLESQIGGQSAAAGAASGKKFGGTFASGAGSAVKAVGIIGLVDIAMRGITGAMSSARQAQKVARTTSAIIKATGGAAKVTSKDVEGLATAISRKTAIDDDSIRTGSNLILTFKNVRNEVGTGNKIFNQATQAAVDLSAAGFGSIESASVMLGKALNDPVKGLTALSRAGVTFTEQQKEQIKTLQQQGDLLGAQKIILKEVQEQVGGTAAAQATNVDKLKTALGELGESAGGDLNARLDRLAGHILSLEPALGRVESAFGRLPGEAHKDINPLLGLFGLLSTDFDKLSKDLESDANVIMRNVGGLPRRIRDSFGDPTGILAKIGSQIVDGLISGLKSKFPSAESALDSLVKRLIGRAHVSLKIGSPSKVFHEIGAFTTLGLAQGIDSQRSTALASVTSLMRDVSATSASLSSRSAFSDAADRPTSFVLKSGALRIVDGQAWVEGILEEHAFGMSMAAGA